MNVRACKHRLAYWLMCLSLMAGLLIPSVPASAQAETTPAETETQTETEAYTIYNDENGLPQMVSTLPASSNLTHVRDGRKETWYSLYDSLNVPTLTVTGGGAVQLILCDGATLTAGSIQVEAGSSLTIWGQPAQGGKLTTSSVAGDLTFNGGSLETSDKLKVNGNLTLNGGSLSAKAGLTVEKNLTVTGGFLDSTGTVQAGQNVTVKSGFVTATNLHANGNLTITGGQIKSSLACGGSMSVTNATVITDNAAAPASITSGVLVKPADGKSGTMTGTVFGSPTLHTDLVVFNNMTLNIPTDQTLTMAAGTTLTNLGTVTGEGSISTDSVVNAEGCSLIAVSPASVTPAKPLSECKTNETDTDGETQYSIGDRDTYVLDQDLTMDKLVIKENCTALTLILPNGLTLRTGSVGLPAKQEGGSKTQGITAADGSDSTAEPSYTLTLSEQSGPFGMLCSNGKGLTFNNGSLTVNDGMVFSNSGEIGAFNLTVTGGTVSSTTKDTEAITVSNLTVNGGSVQGTSQQNVGIHAEVLTVTGGSVTGQNIKTVTGNAPDEQKNCGIAGNGNAIISGGIVASRDSENREADLSYKNNKITITGGVLLCCDTFDLQTKDAEENIVAVPVAVPVEDAVIMAKTLVPEDLTITRGITFSGENGKLVGTIQGIFDQNKQKMIYPDIKAGFTIPERAILRIDHDQELKLEDGVILHNKGDIVNLNTGNNITGNITGNKPINTIATHYVNDGQNTEVYAMVLDQKLLDLYGESLPRDIPYILRGQTTLELGEDIRGVHDPLRLILEDGAEVHLTSNGHFVAMPEIWGQEQNTGKLIHEAPLNIGGSLALHGGSLSFEPTSPLDSAAASLTITDNGEELNGLTVTGGSICENGITVNEGDVTLTGGAIRCTGEAAGLKVTKGKLITTKKAGTPEAGTPGTGWLTGNVQIGNKPLTDYSSYSGVFIHGDVEEVRDNQTVHGEHTVPADHTMTVYGNGSLTIPTGSSLTVNGTLTLEEGASLTGDGTLRKALPVTLAVKNGSWADGRTDNQTTEVFLPNEAAELTGPMTVSFNQEGDVRDQLPTGMKPDPGYEGGSWDSTIVTGDNPTLTYTFAAISSSSGPVETGPVLPKPPAPPVPPAAPETPKAPETPELKPGETHSETKPDGTKVEASKDENGNTTVTETKKDGTVIEAVESASGDKTVTETRRDGTTVKSEETASGDKTVTETRKDGTTVKSEETASGDKTVTETRKDGSSIKSEEKANGDKAITETKKDGSSVREEERANGDTLTTKTSKDGSSVTEAQKPDGTTAKSTTDTEGVTRSEVKVSDKAAEKAAKENKPIELPLPPVKPAEQGEKNAPVIKVELPRTEQGGNAGPEVEIKVTIPVEDPKPGTVAVIVHKDGTEELVRKTGRSENGITIPLEEGVSVRIVDNTKHFDDVPDTHWGKDEITSAVANGIFNGTDTGEFKPDEGMSRGMLAVVLHNLERNPDAAKPDFGDVDPDKYYAEAIGWAAEAGIVSGNGNGFAPDDMITREQLATILWRFAGSPTPKSGRMPFADAGKVAEWAAYAMQWSIENGIITGIGNDMLNPQGTATRAQVAAMLFRFINK